MATENVAVLFTDMVGSTALASSLAPDAADELRRDHFSILRQAVAEAGGTEVKNLGDGLMVVFAATSAALSCAVAMQQAIERDSRTREYPVGLRIGLSGGEVTTEDDDYFGDPVIEAARLCATCAGGQILAADVVRLMAGRRSRHECNSVGALTLKGLPDPVEAVEVRWEPIGGTAGGTVPLPGRLSVPPAAGVVGRATDLAITADAFKRVAVSAGREVVLISGEAGLGKTTLVAEAARAAYAAGACVLFGHCEEDLATPYQLFAEALGHYVTHTPEDELFAHVETYGSELARLVPALASRIPELPKSLATDADTERYLVFAAVVGLLVQVSQHQPVVIVLDDLQWADKGSLLLLRHVIGAEQPMRVLVLGTYRDSELSRAHPLLDTLAALRRHEGVARVELAGLDDTGVMSLLEATVGHALDDDTIRLAHAVYRETDGNPFFVTEVLRHLSETGAITRDSVGGAVTGVPFGEVGLPESVREVIGARVGRLGERAERVLSLAAVIGRDFDFEVLARATATTEEELLDVLDAAVAAALVRELPGSAGRYNFAHALIQHTLYDDLGATRRARAHRQVAEAMEDLYGERPGSRVGELARHWSNATQPINFAKAISYARQAADAALSALAPDDARRYYSQALDLSAQAGDPDEVVAIDLRIGLGTAQRQTGDSASRETLLDAARRVADLGDTTRLVAAALANNRGIFTSIGTVDTDKVEVLELALTRVAGEHVTERALLLAALCSELTYGSTLDRRLALAEEAVAIARSADDAATLVRVLCLVGYALSAPQLLDQLHAWSADALTRAERVGDPLWVYWAADWRKITAGCAGDVAEIDRCLEIAGRMARQLDQPTLHWAHALTSATRALIAGDTDRAERLATHARQIGVDGGEPDAAAMCRAQLIAVSWQRGTMGELFADAEETPDAARAMAYAEADRFDDALDRLESFAAAGFDLPVNPDWIVGMVMYAEAAIVCRDAQHAEPLLERLTPWAGQLVYNDVETSGPVSHYLGGLATVLGRYDEADGYFARAAAFNDRADAKFFAARTKLSWGSMHAERSAPGDAERARDLLTAAQALAVAHRYATVERRAARALQQLG